MKHFIIIEAIHEEFSHVSLQTINGAVNELITRLEQSDYVANIL